MTAQIHDSFLLKDREFSIVGVNGGYLFTPAAYGMQPVPRITSCWRGYVSTYKVLDNKLFLDSLQISLNQEGPAIHNIHPVYSQRSRFDNVYNDLSLPMDFTGGILVAVGFIQQLYVHMGYQPAWKYETVFELSISQGNVLATNDISPQIAELRHRMTRQPLQPGTDVTDQELQEWIASTFRRSYWF